MLTYRTAYAVQVDIAFYNSNAGMFARIVMSFGLRDGGGIVWTYDIQPIDIQVSSCLPMMTACGGISVECKGSDH